MYHPSHHHHHPHHHLIQSAYTSTAAETPVVSSTSSVVNQISSNGGGMRKIEPQVTQHSTPTTYGQNSSSAKSPFKIKLANIGLWKQFEQHGTEMIITKSGR